MTPHFYRFYVSLEVLHSEELYNVRLVGFKTQWRLLDLCNYDRSQKCHEMSCIRNLIAITDTLLVIKLSQRISLGN